MLTLIDKFLIPIESSDSGSTSFTGLKGPRSMSELSIEDPVEIKELQHHKLFFGLYALAHLICDKKSAWLFAAAGGIDKIVHFCCSSVTYTGKTDSLIVAVQVIFYKYPFY